MATSWFQDRSSIRYGHRAQCLCFIPGQVHILDNHQGVNSTGVIGEGRLGLDGELAGNEAKEH